MVSPVTITITGIRQDEPVLGPGSGNTCPDGEGVGAVTAEVRAERQGGNFSGRVYHIEFTATDRNQDSCSGEVPVCVPHDQGTHNKCVDEGPLYDSTKCPDIQVPGRNRRNEQVGGKSKFPKSGR